MARNFARELQKEGIYVTGFFYPVVPKGQAHIVPRCCGRIPLSELRVRSKHSRVLVNNWALSPEDVR
ncbi:hypothetical protein ACLBOM_03350 [Escherichia coli]